MHEGRFGTGLSGQEGLQGLVSVPVPVPVFQRQGFGLLRRHRGQHLTRWALDPLAPAQSLKRRPGHGKHREFFSCLLEIPPVAQDGDAANTEDAVDGELPEEGFSRSKKKGLQLRILAQLRVTLGQDRGAETKEEGPNPLRVPRLEGAGEDQRRPDRAEKGLEVLDAAGVIRPGLHGADGFEAQDVRGGVEEGLLETLWVCRGLKKEEAGIGAHCLFPL